MFFAARGPSVIRVHCNFSVTYRAAAAAAAERQEAAEAGGSINKWRYGRKNMMMLPPTPTIKTCYMLNRFLSVKNRKEHSQTVK